MRKRLGYPALLSLALLLQACYMPLLGAQAERGTHYVGILYETWFNHMRDDGNLDVPVYPEAPAFNGRRYWGLPAIGKYLSTDPAVADLHAEQLAAAGVDFILVDYSNHNIRDFQLHNPIHTLVPAYKARLDAGKAIPRIAFLINESSDDIDRLWTDVYLRYRELYGEETWARLFFLHEGKPLLLPLAETAAPAASNFTLRPTWGLLPQGDTRWSFMEQSPQRVTLREGTAEQMAVSAAQQSTHMSRVDTARGRRWSPLSHRNDGQEGENFQAQWKHALIVRPRFVIIKSWNEWITYGPEHTDEFNPEFSNDLEPMEGGHGDYYYRLLAEYVRIFKR